MTAAETDKLRAYLRKSKSFLEFGCGGSTTLAMEMGCERIDSVDSDPVWIERCRSHQLFARQAGKVTFHYAQVGEVGNWGRPKDRRATRAWSNYPLNVWGSLHYTPDLILVDGRWRVCCCLKSAVMCPESTILFHDFWTRQHYHVVLDHLEIVDGTDDLVALRLRPDHNVHSMYDAIVRHITEFR